MSGTVPEKWREPFPESEIPFILSSVLRCMEGEKKRSPVEKENPISIRLWKKLRCDSELRQRPIQADPEAWEINPNDEDGTIGRLDIRFTYSTGCIHPWPIFAIEAKRLHVTFPTGWQSLVSKYTTYETDIPPEEEQGMMCFITGRYSHGLRAGAMLGYVFDGDVTRARKSIADSITKHREKLKLRPEGDLAESNIAPGISGITESLHSLSDEVDLADPTLGDFTIYHLLVAV